jgi:hypothetical protein
LHDESIEMREMRRLGIVAVALAGVLVELWSRRRTLIVQKSADSRRFVSRRILDRDARESQAHD